MFIYKHNDKCLLAANSTSFTVGPLVNYSFQFAFLQYLLYNHYLKTLHVKSSMLFRTPNLTSLKKKNPKTNNSSPLN